MGWEATLITALMLLLAAFMSGAPLFVAFLAINLTGVAIILGPAGFGMVTNSIFDTTNNADLATIPLFILMAEVLFRSGTVDVLFDAVDKLIGRMKGRQYVLTISLSTVFGALSGAGMAVAAMLARTIFPTADMTPNSPLAIFSLGRALRQLFHPVSWPLLSEHYPTPQLPDS